MSHHYVLKSVKIGKIIRSRRRSISAEFNEDASLLIRAPYWVTMTYIEKFLEERKNWILRNHAIALERFHRMPRRRYMDGEEFLYLGRPYRLKIGPYLHHRLELDEDFRLSCLYVNQARRIFLDWYKRRALDFLPGRIAKYSGLTGIHAKGLRISSATKQWGSCTPENVLCFPWRIMMAPEYVIDSIVVHELTHIRDRTHSQRFWKMVKSVYPDYDASDKWLSENSHLMVL